MKTVLFRPFALLLSAGLLVSVPALRAQDDKPAKPEPEESSEEEPAEEEGVPEEFDAEEFKQQMEEQEKEEKEAVAKMMKVFKPPMTPPLAPDKGSVLP
jgi:hypothetical protein